MCKMIKIKVLKLKSWNLRMERSDQMKELNVKSEKNIEEKWEVERVDFRFKEMCEIIKNKVFRKLKLWNLRVERSDDLNRIKSNKKM